MIIPFFIPHAGCPHQCVFCNQNKITGRTSSPEPSTLAFAIRSYLADAPAPGPVHVAFYGGSFTALPLGRQHSYLDAVQPFILNGSVTGIRVSTRPDALPPEVLDLLREHAVLTVELGAQSMDDEVLVCSGRGHTAQATAEAVYTLRKHGYSVGLQLMPGLPGDSDATFAATVEAVLRLHPDFVRLYPVLVIRDTPLEKLYRDGTYMPLTLDAAVTRCRDAITRFEQAGIDVIRVGLQAADELERPGTVVAGPYHPAFGQLVASALLLERCRALLPMVRYGGSSIILYVHPSDLSTAIGQKRANVRCLQQESGVTRITFRPDAGIPRGQIRSRPSCVLAAPEV